MIRSFDRLDDPTESEIVDAYVPDAQRLAAVPAPRPMP